jgi:hypothetical protein
VPLSPHTRLGPYEIIAATAAGDMGAGYKATIPDSMPQSIKPK